MKILLLSLPLLAAILPVLCSSTTTNVTSTNVTSSKAYKAAADQGDIESVFQYACYKMREGDIDTAETYFLKAAALDHSLACCKLGIFYRSKGESQMALHYFGKAAAQEDGWALYNLSVMTTGKKSKDYRDQAAAAGNFIAQYRKTGTWQDLSELSIYEIIEFGDETALFAYFESYIGTFKYRDIQREEDNDLDITLKVLHHFTEGESYYHEDGEQMFLLHEAIRSYNLAVLKGLVSTKMSELVAGRSYINEKNEKGLRAIKLAENFEEAYRTAKMDSVKAQTAHNHTLSNVSQSGTDYGYEPFIRVLKRGQKNMVDDESTKYYSNEDSDQGSEEGS